jgi:hypothetical protein
LGLTLLSKKTYLSVYVSYSCIYASFAYTDEETEKQHLLKDKSLLFPRIDGFSSDDLLDFWMSYFKGLEEKWGINILDRVKVVNGNVVLNFKVGCKVGVLRSNPNYKELFASLRELSLDIKIFAVDKDFERDLLTNLAIRLDYDDILFLDLNTRFFKVGRVEKEEGDLKSNLNKVKLATYHYLSGKSKREDVPFLLELFNGVKYKTFLSKHISSNFLSNIWGNFLLSPALQSNSLLFKDFVRSYITAQLLSLCSDSPRLNKDFGVKPFKNLLWVTGDLLDIPEFKETLISIIDGLELRGTFDLVFDKDDLIHTFGKTFCLGEKSDEIDLEAEVFLPKFTKVFAPDLDLKPDMKKVVFNGTLFDTKSKSIDVFAPSLELTEIKIKSPKTMYLEGTFIKKAYIEGYGKFFEFRCAKDEILWEKIILDCRVKPVIYGPDAKANNIKFNMWLSGESYS